ncbi:hypothetical protein NLC29_00750 [Candidatus Aminicenantes bacterium AH-873-B07]|jgi:hypothetical protein|nr:hypothetical protein [Candidatus Aminicenantes bacterium AH-873-B07]
MTAVWETLLVIVYFTTFALWSVLSYIFLKKYLKAKKVSPELTGVLFILLFASLSVAFEHIYYGLMVSGDYGFLPRIFYIILSQPQFWILPKIMFLVAGLIMMYIILYKGE